MTKKLVPFLILTVIASGELMACPMCTGQDPRDKYYIYIVGIFVLLIYIPMYYLGKTFFKLRNINNQKLDQ